MSKETAEQAEVTTDLDALCINTIRFLAVDAVQKANSGHPGMPMGAAPMAYVLWTRFLKHNPHNPNWFDRDRFVLSAGHGSMLLYSLLHLTGYDLPLEQLQQFRQWGSRTPGHPERGLTPGVETTTGPLGQGFGNGVGMAIAEASLAARYNRPGFNVIDHYTYAIVSDGDLMEGVAAEAASLAGHLGLGKLIYLYDDNHVSLAATTDITFTEDRGRRFEAYGWHVQAVEDGNDLHALDQALRRAQEEADRPSLILVRTHLGYGSPHKQDTFEAHGSPLGEEEVRLTKQKLGWPVQPSFLVPDSALRHFHQALEKGRKAEKGWQERLAAYAKKYPELARELDGLMEGRLAEDWREVLPRFSAEEGSMATRVALGKVMNATAPRLPALLGGSADLNPSTHTALAGMGDFGRPLAAGRSEPQGSSGGGLGYQGRNLHFGVREHAMGSIVNGLAAHGGTLPYGATFLIFSDYMRPAIRLSALMELHTIFLFTHDSIGLGEDGPTHQPVEQLLSLRAIPGLVVIRPADANETAAAWAVAVERKHGPVAVVLSRQKLPVLDPKLYPEVPLGVKTGGYVLARAPRVGAAQLALIATGAEVHLALAAREQLAREGVEARVVSMPSWNLFAEQPADYRDRVVPPGLPALAIEAGVSLGWRPYVGSAVAVVGVDRFGASAPGPRVLREYGLEVESICRRARELLQT